MLHQEHPVKGNRKPRHPKLARVPKKRVEEGSGEVGVEYELSEREDAAGRV